MVTTKRIERLLNLIQVLQSGKPRTAKNLAEIIGVSRRTVFRDLDLLARTGITYSYDQKTGRYCTDTTTLLPPIPFSHSEALALILATRNLLADNIATEREVAEQAMMKIEGMLPPALQDYCGSYLDALEIRHDPVSDPDSIGPTLPVLRNALATRRKIHAQYDSYYDGQAIDVIIRPYRIAFVHRGWYLIGFSETHGEVRTFKVERIIKLSLSPDVYKIDESFNLESYFRNAWLMIPEDKRYHVKIRFHKMVAANVDEIAWHKTQNTSYQEDGSLIFEVDVDGLKEISWWVLGYGDQAEVLEPPELRGLIGQRAKRLCSYYEADIKQ